MADENVSLDTPFLLKMDPKVALTVIAGYHNGAQIAPDYINISDPTIIEGRYTQVRVTPNPHYQNATGLGREYFNEFSMQYNRLDYGVYFANEVLEVELDLPSNTKALADALGAERNIVFSDDDVEVIPLGTKATQATLKAPSRSLRWIGQVSVNIVYTPSLYDIVPTAYLNGLDMFDYTIDLDVAVYSDILALFEPFSPQPYLSFVIVDPALNAVPSLELGSAPISSYFPETVLEGHWVGDSGAPVVTSDLSLPGDALLLDLINDVAVQPLGAGDYEIDLVTVDPSLGRNTRLRLRGLAQGDLQGTADLHFNRVDFSLALGNNLIDVDLPAGASEQDVRDAVLAQHGLLLDDTISATDQGNGEWLFTATEVSLVFTGTLTVEAYPFWDATPQSQGFYRIPETPYIVYDQTLATSWGPLETDAPLDNDYARWTARINEQNAIAFYLGGQAAFTVLVQPNTPESIDFTFNRNGQFSLIYESDGDLYHVYGNSQGYLSEPLGPGRRPFINRLTWNTDQIGQDTYLFYTRDTDVFYRRQSESYQVEYNLGIDNALAILNTAHDAMFRLVVHYLTTDGDVKNFSTDGGLVSTLATQDYAGDVSGGNFIHL